MKKTVWALLAVCLAGIASAASVTYDVADGKVSATVAKDLKAYLGRRTAGGVFTIEGRTPVIHVGDTAFAREKGLLSDGMKDEEWVVRSFGGDLVLNGRGRGLSLAVASFFDDDCGIRFWSEYEELVPTGDLKLGALNRRGRPAFPRRDVYTTPEVRPNTGRVCAYNGLNWCDSSYGPVPRSGTGGCHSFARYLPSEKHFKAHPDWFMMDKAGHRTIQQPCLTHPGVRAEFKRKLREFIEGDRAKALKNGTEIPAIYDISQNDHGVYCVCPECSAVIAKKGCSGLLLDFINDIAASVKEDYPHVRVMTFAYLWSVEPPKDDTRAADNVIIRFCNTQSNLAGSILDADNTWLLKTLESWRPHAKEFHVWDYAVTYSKGSLGFPMPGEFGLGDLFRTYRNYNVTSIFMEHEQQHRSDMWELKYRLETKLMQNPDADADAIIADFMEKYYGPAGGKVLAYRRYLWHTRLANRGFVRWIPAGDFDYIHADNLAECNRLMDEAEKAVADDATYLSRVRRARLGLDLLTIQRERIAGRGEGTLAKAATDRVNTDWAKWISRYPDKNGWKRLELMSAVGLPPPPQFIGRNIVDFPAVLIKDPERENGGDTVDDPTSPVGLARRLSWNYSKDPNYALPFAAGMWDGFSKRTTVAKSFDKPLGEGWHWYHIGVGRTTAKTTFFMTRSWQIWVASSRFVETWDKDWDMWVSAKFTGPKYGFPSEDGKSYVWIDRMILAEPENKEMPREDPMSAEYRALWGPSVQAEIDARIEKHRKADAVVSGFRPGTPVEIEQLTHDFKFGAHIFNFDQLGSREANDIYKATFTNLLNAATVAYYWKSYEPEKGNFRHAPGPRDNEAFWNGVAALSPQEKYERFIEYRRPAPDPILDFCEANGISMHGHVMIYRVFQPDWVAADGAGDAEVIAAYRRHIRELAAHVGTRISQWDVVNESVRRDAPVTAPDDTVFWGTATPRPVPADYTFACFDEAAKCLPKSVRAAINEACVIDDVYLAFVKSLLDRGARIDTVGLQFHIFDAQEMVGLAHGAHKGRRGYSYTPERIRQTLEKADRLGRPIHISEITIPAPEESPWGEAVQAEALKDLYRLWFSWPSVDRITYWNLVDFTNHKESLSSGFYGRDMRKKAAYHVLDELLNRTWKTRLKLTARADGTVAFRGFRGTYRIRGTGPDGSPCAREMQVK